MKKISLTKPSSIEDLTERLFSSSFFQISVPEDPAEADENQEFLDRKAEELGLPTPSTEQAVIAELDSRGYVEVELTQTDGTFQRFFLKQSSIDAMSELDPYIS